MLLYLSASFSTIDHRILLDWLWELGIRVLLAIETIILWRFLFFFPDPFQLVLAKGTEIVLYSYFLIHLIPQGIAIQLSMFETLCLIGLQKSDICIVVVPSGYLS